MYFAKHLICVISSNSHENPIISVLLAHDTGGKTEA